MKFTSGSTIACTLLTAIAVPAPVAHTPEMTAFATPEEALVAVIHAEGAQVYECKPDSSGRLVWQFREPIATLLRDGTTIGRHYAGPSWELADGEKVVARVSARASGATPDDIPLLKLDVTSTRGDGPLADVATIQRVNTKGGVAEGPCPRAQALLSVPYAADYAFYKTVP